MYSSIESGGALSWVWDSRPRLSGSDGRGRLSYTGRGNAAPFERVPRVIPEGSSTAVLDRRIATRGRGLAKVIFERSRSDQVLEGDAPHQD